ncbi:MAG: copper resistance protein CopC [Chloroflexi bacterium]|nr:copper resistance protein CopC [Chloroflexota bacterium]
MILQRFKRFGFLLVIALVLFSAPAALAHANLVRSEPAANSAQAIAPTRVRLWFSEDVEPRFTRISVVDPTNKAFDQGDSHRMPDDPKGMEISLTDLPPGLYTVIWRALSAVDGHTTAGSFSFTVGDQPITTAPPREIITQVQSALTVSELAPWREIIVQWLSILALILLVGSFTFPILILFPSIREHPERNRTLSKRSEPKREMESNAPRAANWQAWTSQWLLFTSSMVILYALMTAAVLMNQVINVGGDANLVLVILTATRFGYIWLFRVVVLIALGILLFRTRFDSHAMRVWYIGAGLSFFLVIAQSLNSHGAAVGDPPLIPFLTDVMHLLGAAIWIGGLAQLLVVTPIVFQSSNAKERARELAAVIARFSLVAVITVSVIVLTGVFAMFVHVGSFEAFFGTLYGKSLFFKIALVIPLLALAGLNLIVNRPALAQAIAERVDGLVRRFNLSVAFEIIFALAILFIVGIMVSTAPGRAALETSPRLWLQTQRVDGLSITLGVLPAQVGPNDFDVYLRDADGEPVSDASVVRLLGTVREMDMGTQEVTTSPQGDGHYTAHADLLSMVGTWNIEVLARRPGRDDTRTTFTLFAYNQAPTPVTPSTVIALGQPLVQSGLGLALFGFILGAASALFVKPRNPRWIILVGSIVVSTMGAVVAIMTPIPTAAEVKVNVPVVPEFARLARIPFRVDDARIEMGRATFQNNCVVCHGQFGKGDGPGAANLNPKPFDLTVHVPLHTDGELYWYVTNGIPQTAMPAWLETLSDDQRWQVVAYIRRAFGSTPTPTPAP